MTQRGRDFDTDDLFAVRYVSRGRTSELLLSIVGVLPSGTDMKIEAALTGSDRKPVQLRASKMVAVVHQQTGEVIDDPVSWFRFAWLDQAVRRDDVLPLETAIDSLPIDGIGPDRSRRLAAAFADWRDFISTIRGASDELGAFTAKVGLPRAMEHMDFLGAGGADR